MWPPNGISCLPSLLLLSPIFHSSFHVAHCHELRHRPGVQQHNVLQHDFIGRTLKTGDEIDKRNKTRDALWKGTIGSIHSVLGHDDLSRKNAKRITFLSKSLSSNPSTNPAFAVPRGGDDKDSRFSPISSFSKWYMSQMEAHELRTKCISAGILALVGDICAQQVDHSMGQDKETPFPHWDKRRMMAMFADGFVCTGPLLHFVYDFYEKVIPIHGTNFDGTILEKFPESRRQLIAAFIHVLFDNVVMAVFYVGALMIFTAILEGRHKLISYELQHDFVPAVKASWMASLMGLAPLQLISFKYLPKELRVLAVNFLDVIWVTVLSFVTHRNRH